MTILINRRVSFKLAIGLIVISTLLSTSLVHSREDCTSTTAVCVDYTKDGAKICAQKAQYGNSEAAGTTGWYPCYWEQLPDGASACKASKNNDARCSTYQCSMNDCATYTNKQSCETSLVRTSSDSTSGIICDWRYPNADNKDGECVKGMGPLVLCGTKTPVYSPV